MSLLQLTDLERNQVLDAESWLRSLDHKPGNADLVEAAEQDIHVDLLGKKFVTEYEGTNGFIRKMKKFPNMTQSQLRVVLQIWFEQTEPALAAAKKAVEVPVEKHQCYDCDEIFDTFDELTHHKVVHGTSKTIERTHAEIPSEGIAVIADTTSTSGLDLTNLPDGCYAAPDPSGRQEHVYFMVKRVKRTHFRDRRYRYGKITTGSEVVLAGTIEVREWKTDSKELLGEQRPGDVYRGKFENELDLIMMVPQHFAKLFALHMKRCFICRKALTDDISQAIGMGKDCEEKYGPKAYFEKKPDDKLQHCPTCGKTDIRLTYIDGKSTVFFNHPACKTSFKVYKNGDVEVTS